MADEWLRAEVVAAMQTRIGLMGFTELGASIDALVAQDGRWRALARGLLDHVSHEFPCEARSPLYPEHCSCGLDGWIAQAQAALDGARGQA